MRKTKVVTIPGAPSEELGSRDNGKLYLVTEMPASQSEKWAARAITALSNAGFEVPEETASLGMAAVAIVGIRALARVSFHEAEPLMDEMMMCVQAIPDPARPAIVRALVENDVEEVKTRLLLRSEVLELHTGFSLAGTLLRVLAEREAQMTAAENLSSTSTSPTSSASSSPIN
jgi:hypothetical protein